MSTRKMRLTLLAVILLAGAVGCTQTAKQISGTAPPSGRPPLCSANLPSTPPPLHPTTVTTIGQAYYCVFAHYYAGPVLDDRVLLAAAFAGFTQELNRLGTDRPDATMPALTGHRDQDWTAFAAAYQKVASQLPASPAQRQELATATLTGMIASLHDNHAQWDYPAPPPGSVPGDLGIMTSPGYLLVNTAPEEALPPLFVTAVEPGSPAGSHGMRPGDVIVAVNGAPPFADGIISKGAMNLLFGPYPQAGRVSVRLHRPATGRTWTVTLTPAFNHAPPSPGASPKLLNRDIAYVQLSAFFPGAADAVLGLISNLAPGVKLHGLILDLRWQRRRPRRSGSATRGNRGTRTAGAPLSGQFCTGSSSSRFHPEQIGTLRATARTSASAGSGRWRSCGSVRNSTGAFSPGAQSGGDGHGDRLRRLCSLCCGFPFMAGAFARRAGSGNVTQDRGEHRDRCRVFDPFGKSVLDPGTPRVVRAGFPDGFPFLVAQGRPPGGGGTLGARPVVRVRAFTCRRACQRQGGTTGGTITHGDGSSGRRARQCPRLHLRCAAGYPASRPGR
jgi:hypothetical protein